MTGTERDEGQEMRGGAEPSSGYLCSHRSRFVSLGNCRDNGNCHAGETENYVCKLARIPARNGRSINACYCHHEMSGQWCWGLMLAGELPQHLGPLEGAWVDLRAALEQRDRRHFLSRRQVPTQAREEECAERAPPSCSRLLGCHSLAQAPISSSFPTLPPACLSCYP